MSAQRWSAIAKSQYAWEREALEFLREHLPDQEPWQVWSNFEFIDDAGRVNEVDALILSPHGLFLVEIKSRPGTLDGDSHSWAWTTDGRRYTDDNPLLLANRKAKRLATVLRRQPSVARSHQSIPYITEVIFLSAANLNWRMNDATAQRVFGRKPSAGGDGIINVLTRGLSASRGHPPINPEQARMIRRAVDESGIRPSLRDRRVGDYELKRILDEGDGWQDWEGRHVSLNVPRRIRLHPYAASATDEARRAIGRLAAREFQILEGVDHPGILKVREYKDTDRGPALIFEHDPKAIRLDLLLREHLDLMSADLRLHLLRQLAETLNYAHGKRLYHRALSPQSILVRDADQERPRLQVMNWSTAARSATTADGAPGGTSGPTHGTNGTEHLGDYVDDPAKIYIAPEALQGGMAGSGPHHDVFSLAAIAFHLFTGQPPAATPLDLATKLRTDGGLRVSDRIDGAMQSLVDLIRLGTHPDVSLRIASMDEFLERLGEVERDMRLGVPETTVDPAVAKTDDRLDGGFTVVRRLGRGASADALLVRPDDQDEELVLKVALDPSHNDRIRAEGAVLAALHHQNIVKARRTLTVAGRSAILMERAGAHTLAQHLRSEDRLSLDLIRRFGEELLSAVDFLEQAGVVHRDIKPDNIGITEGKDRKRLVLFDFSLTRTSPDNIQAGTRPYLDPFLPLRKPPRWDLHAERFAVAVTLYEMLTSRMPVWGDGQSDCTLIEDEATIDTGRFDPLLRQGLTAFFAKALRREASRRHDNAEDMARAWRQVFDQAAAQSAAQSAGGGETEDFDAVAHRATAQTSIVELGYGVEAQNVLDRMGIHNARDLLAVDRRNLRFLTGVGDRIRREIRETAKRLAQLRPDLVPGSPSPSETAAPPGGQPSIDRLAESLIPRRPLGDERVEDRALSVFLGLEAMDSPQPWPTVGQVAAHCDVARTAVAAALAKGRERWIKQALLNGPRDDIRALLAAQGGVMTASELARQLLALRGSSLAGEEERLRLSAAVVRAVADAESARAEPQFEAFEDAAVPVLAETLELAIHAQTLGQTADALALRDPPPTPQRAMEELLAHDWPERGDLPPPKPARVLALAVAASGQAALSGRHEIYRRGLSAEAVLRLALGSLLGPRMLAEDELRERVRSRYPDAAPLPPRPLLDRLLTEAGAGRVWRNGPAGEGYYSDRDAAVDSTGVSSIHRFGTEGPAVDVTPAVMVAQQLEDKLDYARRSGGFLALTVDPRRYQDAERELLERFPLRRVSVDRLMLDALRNEAQSRKVDWSLVLRADAAEPQSRDWINLQRLLGLALPKIERFILEAKDPLLLTDAGLFARYDLMDRLQPLRDASGTVDGPPGLWLLLPLPGSGLPTIGGRAVPVIGPNQWARLTDAWIGNHHRAGSRASGP